jgi:hypothetical protein
VPMTLSATCATRESHVGSRSRCTPGHLVLHTKAVLQERRRTLRPRNVRISVYVAICREGAGPSGISVYVAIGRQGASLVLQAHLPVGPAPTAPPASGKTGGPAATALPYKK